jgi:hypothetical protein
MDEWSAKSGVSFKNLAPDYTFKVKAKFANSTLENTAIYRLKFLNPGIELTLLFLFTSFLFLL